MLIPEEPDQPVQLIDVRDLAEWLLDATQTRLGGTFDAVGDRSTLGEVLASCAEVAGHHGPVIAVAPERLASHGVTAWMGPRSLPLWLGDRDWWGFQDHQNSAARAAGLELRPLADTIRDTLVWERARTMPRGAGLTEVEHAEVLAAVSSAD